MASNALTLSNIDAFYGDSHVLQQVSFVLGESRLLGLLGRNGAGKSTCINVAVGLLPARAGAVEVFGADVTRLQPEHIAARGVALVPQGRRIFKSLTVRENLAVAARQPKNGGRNGKAAWTAETVFAMFPRLRERPIGDVFEADARERVVGAGDEIVLPVEIGERIPAQLRQAEQSERNIV